MIAEEVIRKKERSSWFFQSRVCLRSKGNIAGVERVISVCFERRKERLLKALIPLVKNNYNVSVA